MRQRCLSGGASIAARRFARIMLILMMLPFIVPTTALAVTAGNSPEVTPPSEKILCQYGLWKSEFWADDGVLGFYYTGDPYPTVENKYKMNKAVDFNIGTPTLLTCISDVHIKEVGVAPADSAGVEVQGSPGTLSLVDGAGNIYGPFAVESVVSQKESTTVLWIAMINHVELQPGHYKVLDSDVSTLLCNGQAHDVCATFVKGVDEAAYKKYMDALDVAVNGKTVISSARGSSPAVTYSNPESIVNITPGNNTGEVSSNPAAPAVFTTENPVMVTKILDFHMNNGKGKPPGFISLQDSNGRTYGPWQAYGQSYRNTANAVWAVTPDLDIPAGTYTVIDSDPTSQSADPSGKAMCVLSAAPSVTIQATSLSGKYTFNFETDQANGWDLPVTVIDMKKTIELDLNVEEYSLQIPMRVTSRTSSKVTASYSFKVTTGWYVNMAITFTKNGDKFVPSGMASVSGDGKTSNVPFTGKQLSSTIPGYAPTPASGIGKMGSIPGPATTDQATVGIAASAVAVTAAAGIAAAFGGFSGGGSGGGGTSKGDGGGSGSDGTLEGDGGGSGGDGTSEGDGGGSGGDGTSEGDGGGSVGDGTSEGDGGGSGGDGTSEGDVGGSGGDGTPEGDVGGSGGGDTSVGYVGGSDGDDTPVGDDGESDDDSEDDDVADGADKTDTAAGSELTDKLRESVKTGMDDADKLWGSGGQKAYDTLWDTLHAARDKDADILYQAGSKMGSSSARNEALTAMQNTEREVRTMKGIGNAVSKGFTWGGILSDVFDNMTDRNNEDGTLLEGDGVLLAAGKSFLANTVASKVIEENPLLAVTDVVMTVGAGNTTGGKTFSPSNIIKGVVNAGVDVATQGNVADRAKAGAYGEYVKNIATASGQVGEMVDDTSLDETADILTDDSYYESMRKSSDKMWSDDSGKMGYTGTALSFVTKSAISSFEAVADGTKYASQAAGTLYQDYEAAKEATDNFFE